jgi:hypothetical protein
MKRLLLCFTFSCVSILSAQIGFEQNTVIDKSYGLNRPNAVATGDINGDGLKDILVGNDAPGLSILMALDNQGNFSKPITIDSYGYNYLEVGIADFDGDGFNDVIYSLNGPNDRQMYWKPNTDGLGNFGNEQLLFETNRSQFVYFQATDMDNDGDIDVFYGSNTYVAIQENDGSGSFTNTTYLGSTTSSATRVDFMHAADLDGDGRKDIIVDRGYDLQAYKNESDGSISFIELVDTFAQGNDFWTADVDHDNDLDIIMFFNNGNTKRFQWFENTDGLGTFANEQILIDLSPMGGMFSDYKFKVVDIDNDLFPDVVLMDASNNTYKWYRNLMNNTFSTGNIISTDVKTPNSTSIVDVNADGSIDLISTSYTDSKVSLYLNTDGLGNYGPQQSLVFNALFVNQVDAGDIDGDGDLDLIASAHAENSLTWYENVDGLGNYKNDQILISNDQKAIRYSFLRDMDLDGDKDVVFYTYDDQTLDTSTIKWLANDGLGNFTTETIITVNNEWILHLVAEDVDNDGDTDVIAVYNGDILEYYMNDGTGNFGTPQPFGTPNSSKYALELTTGDLDGDNDLDVLVSYNNNEIAWYNNADGLGAFTSKTVITPTMNYPFALYAADADGDNDLDVFFVNRTRDEIGWFENTDGLGNFGLEQLITYTGDNPTTIYTMDLDSDGDQDVIADDPGSNKLDWYQNDGTGTFTAATEISNNITRLSSIIHADINADGILDVVTTSYDDDQVAWFENLGAFDNTIEGTVSIDLNANGCDPDDVVYPRLMVTTQNGMNTFSTFTQTDGTYSFSANEDTFITTVNSPLSNYTSSPNTFSSNFSTTGNTDIVDFCFVPTSPIEDIYVSIIGLEEPQPGFNADYIIKVQNNGTIPVTTTVSLDYNSNYMDYLSASAPVIGQTMNSLNFELNSLLPFESKYYQVSFTMKTIPTVTLGDRIEVTATANNTTDDFLQDNTARSRQILIGSYDPNDMRCVEGNELLISDLDSDFYLHYIIRFQNTGTAAARRVRVETLLDSKLDWDSIILEGSSHKNRVEITEGNRVNFIFDAIYLPDSTTDEPGSNGYITYRIQPKSNVVLGDIFNAQADIYFDFNPAIVTNLEETEIVTVLSVADASTNTISIYPNPANDLVQIQHTAQIHEVIIYNQLGKRMLQTDQSELNIANLKQGLYFMQITDVDGFRSTLKLIKE